MTTHRQADVKAAQDKKRKRRSHKNRVTRLTAKERAVELVENLPFEHGPTAESMIQSALQANAREAVARHRRKHGSVLLRPFAPAVIDDSRPLFSSRRKRAGK